LQIGPPVKGFLSTKANFLHFSLGAPCPQNYNPADFYVQLLAIAPNREQECRDTIKKICDSFAVSQVAQDLLEKASVNTKTGEFNYYEKRPSTELVKMGYRATWWTQFYAILWRSWLSVLKEPLLVKVRLLQTIVST
jgi:ATP-binding cassette, subfamily G (WHITE), eye pigment precursor transporter